MVLLLFEIEMIMKEKKECGNSGVRIIDHDILHLHSLIRLTVERQNICVLRV